MQPFKPYYPGETSFHVSVQIITVIVFFLIGLTLFFFLKSYFGIRLELRRYHKILEDHDYEYV